MSGIAPFLFALFAALGCCAAQAQGWPSRPVRFIVPTAPGGSTDAIVSQMPLMKLPYDPFRDFEPVAILATIPYGIVVSLSRATTTSVWTEYA